MRILVLEPSARDEGAAFPQRLDDGLVRIALVALVGDDALALEPGRFLGEGSVLIHGVGNARFDASLDELAAIRHPEFEILASVTRGGVNEACPRLLGDMVASEKRDNITITQRAQGMRAGHFF